jgi:hypothetical protein
MKQILTKYANVIIFGNKYRKTPTKQHIQQKQQQNNDKNNNNNNNKTSTSTSKQQQ